MIEQRTDEWFQQRLGKVTASRIADVMMKPTTAGYQNYRAQIVCERLTGTLTESFTSAAMQHGTDTETRARAMYEMETGLDVVEAGFVHHPSLAMSGASPDGLVGESGLVEIKCPQPAEHIRMLTGGNVQGKYFLQMQWQMACTAREWCDFVSFSDAMPIEMQVFRVRVDREPEKIEEITAAVTQFLAEVDRLESDLTKRYGMAAQ